RGDQRGPGVVRNRHAGGRVVSLAPFDSLQCRERRPRADDYGLDGSVIASAGARAHPSAQRVGCRTGAVLRRPERRGADAVSGARRVVCMIAYTNYAFDARVRREAETLASQGFRVLCLTTQNAAAPAQFVLDGVEVRELRVPKYRGKNRVAYIASYVHF